MEPFLHSAANVSTFGYLEVSFADFVVLRMWWKDPAPLCFLLPPERCTCQSCAQEEVRSAEEKMYEINPFSFFRILLRIWSFQWRLMMHIMSVHTSSVTASELMRRTRKSLIWSILILLMLLMLLLLLLLPLLFLLKLRLVTDATAVAEMWKCNFLIWNLRIMLMLIGMIM